MRKKSFKVIVFMAVFSFIPFFSSAQWAVIDVSAIAAAIENGYTLYQTLNNAYQTYQKSVETYNHMVKMAQGLDFSNPGLILEQAYKSFEDTMMKKLDNLESIYDSKTMSINGYRFSIKDLYTTDVYERIMASYEDMSPSDIEALTTEEERAFFAANGISPKNGLIIKNLGQEFDKCLMESQAKLEVTASIPDFMREYTQKVTGDLGINSEIALAQQSNDIAANHLKVAVESYELTRDMLKMSNANYAMQKQKEAQEQMAMEYFRSLNEVEHDAGINEDSSYLGPTRKK